MGRRGCSWSVFAGVFVVCDSLPLPLRLSINPSSIPSNVVPLGKRRPERTNGVSFNLILKLVELKKRICQKSGIQMTASCWLASTRACIHLPYLAEVVSGGVRERDFRNENEPTLVDYVREI